KAPKSNTASAVDKNVRKALHQAKCVIYDSRRMRNVHDSTIERELRKSAAILRSMRHLVFINRHGEVIDIK
ncbi:MAG: hypothetical protein RR619_02995, partial [Raoultibacter sp.]